MQCFNLPGGAGTSHLDQAISVFEHAIQLTPEIDPQKNDLLLSLAKAFIARFENVQRKQCFDLLRDISNLDRAISILDNGVQLMPNTNPKKHNFLFSLGQACLTRFENLQQTVDLDKAIDSYVDHLISVLELAVMTVPGGSSQKLWLLCRLVSELSWHIDEFKQLADVDKIISAQAEVVELSADTDPDHIPLYFLANSQTRRSSLLKGDDIAQALALLMWGETLYLSFLRDGKTIDIDAVVTSLQDALGLVAADDPDRHRYLHSLMGMYAERFDQLHSVSDVDNAIVLCHEALSQTPSEHPDKLSLLTNQGICHNDRFRLLREQHDIDAAILLHREAVKLASKPEKATYLHNLGTALCIRFHDFTDMSDLDAGLRAYSDALEVTPKNHLEKKADIDKSIEYICRAIELRPENDPKRSFCSSTFGWALGERYEQFHSPADLSEALASLQQAAMSPAGLPRTHLDASILWTIYGRQDPQDPKKQLLDVYEVMVDLIPRLVWLGSTIQECHKTLPSISEHIREAVMGAHKDGQPDRAVEWLEQGRSIVWSQHLNLHTPVDDLKAANPTLAARLVEIG
ncbi:hypothetical protein EVG20_g11460 [Dentipellis fragilis]|uniref:TPR-like protein n=1 Tax=Dentipellis fragilis TaxID=205917 RepID=A0A4Y9XKP4_9AGAM|nr:hypothetical protein EVG20_g11460 [Dentipellis fragilis]